MVLKNKMNLAAAYILGWGLGMPGTPAEGLGWEWATQIPSLGRGTGHLGQCSFPPAPWARAPALFRQHQFPL